MNIQVNDKMKNIDGSDMEVTLGDVICTALNESKVSTIEHKKAYWTIIKTIFTASKDNTPIELTNETLNRIVDEVWFALPLKLAGAFADEVSKLKS